LRPSAFLRLALSLPSARALRSKRSVPTCSRSSSRAAVLRAPRRARVSNGVFKGRGPGSSLCAALLAPPRPGSCRAFSLRLWLCAAAQCALAAHRAVPFQAHAMLLRREESRSRTAAVGCARDLTGRSAARVSGARAIGSTHAHRPGPSASDRRAARTSSSFTKPSLETGIPLHYDDPNMKMNSENSKDLAPPTGARRAPVVLLNEGLQLRVDALLTLRHPLLRRVQALARLPRHAANPVRVPPRASEWLLHGRQATGAALS